MLPRLLPREGVVGFSGGYTVAQLAGALEPLPDTDLTLVPLQGNWVDGGAHLPGVTDVADNGEAAPATILNELRRLIEVVRSGSLERKTQLRNT